MILEFKVGRKVKKVGETDSPTTMAEIEAFCKANGFLSGVIRRVYEDGGNYKKYDYQWKAPTGQQYFLGHKLWTFCFGDIYKAWQRWGGIQQTNELVDCLLHPANDGYPVW